MLLAETNPDNVVHVPQLPARHERPDVAMVSVQQGMFAWSLEGFNTPPVLKNINFAVKAKQVGGVCEFVCECCCVCICAVVSVCVCVCMDG